MRVAGGGQVLGTARKWEESTIDVYILVMIQKWVGEALSRGHL